jgi:hypothetical protein
VTALGWLFMGTAWVTVIALSAYSFGRLLREDRRGGPGRPGQAP